MAFVNNNDTTNTPHMIAYDLKPEAGRSNGIARGNTKRHRAPDAAAAAVAVAVYHLPLRSQFEGIPDSLHQGSSLKASHPILRPLCGGVDL
jgi:hypothetical protein